MVLLVRDILHRVMLGLFTVLLSCVVQDRHYPQMVDVHAIAQSVTPLWKRIECPSKRIRQAPTDKTIRGTAAPGDTDDARDITCSSDVNHTDGQHIGCASLSVRTVDSASSDNRSATQPTTIPDAMESSVDLPQLRFFTAAEDDFECIYEAAAVEVFWEHAMLDGSPAGVPKC